MSADAELLVFIAGMHVAMIVFAGVLLRHFMISETLAPWTAPEDDEGSDDPGRGNDRRKPREPAGPGGGGTPLPDAEQSRVRLREGGRLSDLLPRPERRPHVVPGRRRRIPS